MVLDIVRDSTFGQLVNLASRGRLFPYADQRPDYVVPQRYLAAAPASVPLTASPTAADSRPAANELGSSLAQADGATLVGDGDCAFEQDNNHAEDVEKGAARPVALPPLAEDYPYLVRFEEDDSDRPLNWSTRKRLFIGGLICFFNFAVYVGASVYTSSITSLMEDFGVGHVAATAGLTLFVAAYGIGPMLLSPMQEMPSIGRNPVYIIGLALFLIFHIPQIVANNFVVILVSRFFSGFVGSPAIATGGASLVDIFPPEHVAVAIGVFAMAGVCGPIAGPVIGGFAAEANGWRWPLLEELWLAGFTFVVLFFSLPETYEPTILLRRAQRLRRLTGNNLIRAPCELRDGSEASLGRLLGRNLTRALRISLDPSVLVANSYTGLVYAEFYVWFESFPIIFNEIHGFGLGVGGLPYLGFLVSAVPTLIFYILYQRWYIASRMAKDPNLPPEIRLELGVWSAPIIPICLFITGWTAREDVHWIWPIVGASLYIPGIYYAFQAVYISTIYIQYAASVLAGNALFRSLFGSVFPLFGAQLFRDLGLGGGSSLLAGISILMIPLLWLIMHYGPVLRARSNFAVS
ncbi:hypothetical protein JCM10207_003045 [Rhodosporidiobolus poonsookiae]